MRTSYHVHTRHSDGEGSVSATVARARALGLDELGISDHFMVQGAEELWWAMAPGDLPDYLAAVQAQLGSLRPRVRLGLEVDWFEDQRAAIAQVLGELPLDYAIGSVHQLWGMHMTSAAGLLRGPRAEALMADYWRQVRLMAESGLFDVVGHLDLPKLDLVLPELEAAALDAIAAAGMAVELNTSGWHKAIRGAYPRRELLEGCFERGIPALVTSDAHRLVDLDRDLDRGAALLWEVGYREVVRLEGRQLLPVPLG